MEEEKKRKKRGNPGGRPTKYSPEIQEKADYYAAGGWIEAGDAIPSAAGLCCYIGIVRQMAFTWRDMFPKFSDTLQKISIYQESVTLSKSITGVFNPTISKLILANHGYHERQYTDITTNGESLNKGRTLDDFYNKDVPAKPES